MKLSHLVALALATLALFAFVAPAAQEPARVEPVTVVLVRHAEKANEHSRDPKLTEAGEARATELARVLANAGVTHLFASEFVRTKTTLAPLAQELGLEVEVVSANDGKGQVEKLQQLEPGSVAVVAGHSNTVPALVMALGGRVERTVEHERYGPMLGDKEYDRLFVVTLPVGEGGETKTVELAFGE